MGCDDDACCLPSSGEHRGKSCTDPDSPTLVRPDGHCRLHLHQQFQNQPFSIENVMWSASLAPPASTASPQSGAMTL